MSKNLLKPSIAVFLILLSVIPSVFFLAPGKASASGVACIGGLAGGIGGNAAGTTAGNVAASATAVPVISVTGNVLQAYGNGVNTGTQVQTLATCIQQLVLIPLARMLIRALLQQLTSNIISFINHTPTKNGNFVTSYIQNLPAMLTTLGDSIALSMIGQFITAFNSPFGPAISSVIRVNYSQNTSLAGFYAANQCTLNQSSPNINAFLAGNWSQGGIGAWIALTTKTANNPYMLYYAASARVSNSVNQAQAYRQQDLLQSSGYMSWCGTKDTSAHPPAAGNSSIIAAPKDPCVNADGSPSKVLTPGSVIHDYVQKGVVASGFDQLISANDIDSALNAIISALLKQVLGATGLFGASSSGGNGAPPLTTQLQTYSNTATTTSASQNAAQTAQGVLTNYTAYTNAWNTILTAAKNASNTLNKLINSCSSNGTISQQTSSAQTIVLQIISQANAALQSVQSTQALALKVQTEASSVVVPLSLGSDLATLLTMPPSSTDVATAQANANVTGGATANPSGSLTVSGGSLIDQLNLINKNAAAQSNGCVVVATSTPGP